MATAPKLLTLEEFYAQFDNGYEYWFGEAVKRGMGTWLHCLLQAVITELLRRAGYIAGPELELRLETGWRPKPDVVGARSMQGGKYPTEPVEIIVEILSPDDEFPRVRDKLRNYTRQGHRCIFLLDPEARTGYRWDGKSFLEIDDLTLPNGRTIDLIEVWKELDGRMQPRTE